MTQWNDKIWIFPFILSKFALDNIFTIPVHWYIDQMCNVSDLMQETTGAYIIVLYLFIGKRRAQATIAVYVYNVLHTIERTDALWGAVANLIT